MASTGTSLPTEAVVFSAIDTQITNFASSIGGSSYATASGITVSVDISTVSAEPTVQLSVVLDTDIGPSQTIPASGNDPEAEGYTPEVPAATDEEVKKAYREMAKKNHPDLVSNLGEEVHQAAEKKFQEINEAYELIKKQRGM